MVALDHVLVWSTVRGRDGVGRVVPRIRAAQSSAFLVQAVHRILVERLPGPRAQRQIAIMNRVFRRTRFGDALLVLEDGAWMRCDY